MFTPAPVKSMREQHFKIGLLPKITLDELRLSLSLRHGDEYASRPKLGTGAGDIVGEILGDVFGSKKDKATASGTVGSKAVRMNKYELAMKLGEDLEFEKFKQIDSAALAQMEQDISVLEKSNKVCHGGFGCLCVCVRCS